MPTLRVTSVQPTFVQETFGHIRNISAVTDPILTKSLGPNFLQALTFLIEIFLPKFCEPKIFSTQGFVWTSIYLEYIFFTLNFLESNFFGLKMLNQILFGWKNFGSTNFSWTNIFFNFFKTQFLSLSIDNNPHQNLQKWSVRQTWNSEQRPNSKN